MFFDYVHHVTCGDLVFYRIDVLRALNILIYHRMVIIIIIDDKPYMWIRIRRYLRAFSMCCVRFGFSYAQYAYCTLYNDDPFSYRHIIHIFILIRFLTIVRCLSWKFIDQILNYRWQYAAVAASFAATYLKAKILNAVIGVVPFVTWSTTRYPIIVRCT